MLDTFLFDLDGTLLPIDMDSFMKIYMEELGLFFKGVIAPETLKKALWSGVHDMVKNDGGMTNQEVFIRKFCSLVERDRDELTNMFERFYKSSYLNTRTSVSDIPLIRESVAELKARGYQMIIATNPVYPREAIDRRIEWAGFYPDDFIYISSYENSHFCKPSTEFYREILEHTGKTPGQCIMVGNDVQEDLAASDLGMQTYLIRDFIIHRGKDEPVCTYSGDYEDFHLFVKKLKPLV